MHWKSLAVALYLMALPLQAIDSRPVIVAFGDSMTAGFGVPSGFSYPEQLQKKLDAAGYKYRVVNMGITGDTTRGGRARMDRVLAANPTIVILELGGNDRSNGLSPGETQANLAQMIATFQKTRITVLLVERDSEKDNVYTALAATHHLPLISNFFDGVAGNAEFTISDGRHPNAEGYAIVVTNVLKTLKPFL